MKLFTLRTAGWTQTNSPAGQLRSRDKDRVAMRGGDARCFVSMPTHNQPLDTLARTHTPTTITEQSADRAVLIPGLVKAHAWLAGAVKIMWHARQSTVLLVVQRNAVWRDRPQPERFHPRSNYLCLCVASANPALQSIHFSSVQSSLNLTEIKG